MSTTDWSNDHPSSGETKLRFDEHLCSNGFKHSSSSFPSSSLEAGSWQFRSFNWLRWPREKSEPHNSRVQKKGRPTASPTLASLSLAASSSVTWKNTKASLSESNLREWLTCWLCWVGGLVDFADFADFVHLVGFVASAYWFGSGKSLQVSKYKKETGENNGSKQKEWSGIPSRDGEPI